MDFEYYNLFGEYIKISIKDNGVGLNKETKNKVFVPFSITKDVGNAAGTRLSIFFGIIEKHKLKIYKFRRVKRK